jgi:hypothetical protein
MSATPSWYIEGRVIRLKLTDVVQENQLSALDKMMTSFLRNGTNPQVHLILDISELNSLPSITALNKMSFLRHHRHGWWVIVGKRTGTPAHNTLHLLGDTYQILHTDKADENAAQNFIRAVDPTMPVRAMA